MIEAGLSCLVWSTFAVALSVLIMFLRNLAQFRPAPKITAFNVPTTIDDLTISVLVPARNEALRIGRLLDSVLNSEGVICEICVLDDESDDGTDRVVREYAQQNPNVRLLAGTPVPTGWSGKQFACWQLAQHARYPEFVFLDADVVLSADALHRAVLHRRQTQSDLLSGFPKQHVVTFGEQLLIPLIHLILLCFLPFRMMRTTSRVEAAAGCGQFLLTTQQAYRQSGGHSAIRNSLHDGVMLPRAYRIAGLKTDLFDGADIATCRMYSSFNEVWSGLLKNATEGFAKLPLLPFITLLMLMAFVVPWVLATASLMGLMNQIASWPIVLACVASSLPRFICCARYDRAWLASALNPLSIVLFLVNQWTALLRHYRGQTVNWRQRNYEVCSR